MPDWLTARVRATPEATALIIGEERWTYGELERLVNGVCGRLLDAGVRPGQFVGVLLPNSLVYVCLIHALARLGAVLVPLNTRLTPAELQWQIEHVGCKLVLYSEKIADEWLMVNSQWLMVNETWLQPTSLTINHYQFTINHYQSVVFTSGTSGKPKGVPLTFNNHFYSAMASAYRLGVRPDDLWLSCLPLYHVGGLAVIWRSCLYGTAVNLHPRFILENVNQALDALPVTLISLVPTMLRRLLETRTHWPAALRLILLGGAAAPPELIEQANKLPRKWLTINDQRLMVNETRPPFTINHSQLTINHSPPLVAPTYGLTEASSQAATMPPAAAAKKPGSVGKPLLFTRIEIVDENGRPLPPNEYGEIVVSGPTVMSGYFEDQRLKIKDWQAGLQSSIFNPSTGSGQVLQSSFSFEDQRTKIKDWTPDTHQSSIFNLQSSFSTGDIGYLDEDGDLWLVQRRTDLIVSGGENVYPAEVEKALRGHTAVAQACVVGIPDAEWGQKVAAMVQLRPGTSLTEAELVAFCREHLAGYKIPRLIRFTDTLPQTASGKIARSEAAAQLAGE